MDKQKWKQVLEAGTRTKCQNTVSVRYGYKLAAG